ncbi:MAG: hypothetical protein KGI73_04080 [Patescibacteria group bacterium]|nr:hypothetical protein [Patescibacteria group bacterium]
MTSITTAKKSSPGNVVRGKYESPLSYFRAEEAGVAALRPRMKSGIDQVKKS